MARWRKASLALDTEMAQLLEGLLGIVKVAIISGGTWQQFETQILTICRPASL